MFEINFVREKVFSPEKREKASRIIRLLCGAGLLGLVILVGITASLYLKISSLNQEKSILDETLARRSQEFKIDDFKREWQSFYAELRFFEEIMSAKIYWVPRLQELEQILPAGIWIRKLSTRRDRPVLELELVALSERQQEFSLVKEFIDALEKSPFFGPGKLESQGNTRVQKEDAKFFKITVPLEKEAVEAVLKDEQIPS